jgi:HTH-type transcriptional regulator/antitoxin HigA
MNIKNNEENEAALKRIDEIWNAELNSPEGKELDQLVNAVVKYEDSHINFDQK